MKYWCSIVALLIAGGCSHDPRGPYEGQRLPALEGSLMRGGAFSSGALAGKPSMVVFWASWCGPCRQEAPQIAKVAKEYGPTIDLIGVNAGESVAVAQRAAGSMAISWPVVMDADGSIQKAFKVSGIPLVLIADKDGVVRHRNNGVPSNVHRLLDGLVQ